MERSVLHDSRRHALQAFAVAGRPRLATCSGAAWFRGYHLAVVNLYGHHLRIYRFQPGDGLDGGTPRLDLLHEMNEGICGPEEVAISRDGRLLAVSHSLSDDLGVSLHRLDASTLAPDPAGDNLRRGRLGSAFHGLDFSPDSRHLAFTQIGDPSYVEVVRVGPPAGQRTCLLENRYAPMRLKGVAFSSDGQFAVITMAFNARPESVALPPAGIIAIHSFDAEHGVIDPEPVARLDCSNHVLAYADLCTFLPSIRGNRYRVLVADQALDAVMAFDFDAEDRTLVFAGAFADGLPFPHGVSASADGRFVAITTYGDDAVRIVSMQDLPQALGAAAVESASTRS
jgi:hypothetical protein